jgi:hypothetical protein
MICEQSDAQSPCQLEIAGDLQKREFASLQEGREIINEIYGIRDDHPV